MQNASPFARGFVNNVLLPFFSPPSFRKWVKADPGRVGGVAFDLTKYFWTVISCWILYIVIASLMGLFDPPVGEAGNREASGQKLKRNITFVAKESGILLLHSLAFSLAFVTVFYPVGLPLFEGLYGLHQNDGDLEMFLLWRTFISQLLASTLTFPLIKFSNWTPLAYFCSWLCASIYSFIVFQRD